MKRLAVLLIIGCLLIGCSKLNSQTVSDNQKRYYFNTEIIVSDFSKKIKAYYEMQHQQVPNDFNEKTYIELLEKMYPDQNKVQVVKNNFHIEARAINDNFSVMLCDPSAGRKIMEDLSCHLENVAIRCWDKKEPCPCIFEKNWETYCK